jgi:hypothetical protein
MGARIIVASSPAPPWGCRDCPRPKKAKFASIVIAPASVAVIVMISVSRFLIWASSCAITPATSSRVRAAEGPVVAATAAFSGLRPVAKALG